MTAGDAILLVFAVLDILFVGALAYAGYQLYQTGMRGKRQMDPALREAQELRDRGQRIARQVKGDVTAIGNRVTTVAHRVQRRLATTRRLAREVLPEGRATAEAAQEASQEVRGELQETRGTLRDLTQRVSRIRSAARSAADAARRP